MGDGSSSRGAAAMIGRGTVALAATGAAALAWGLIEAHRYVLRQVEVPVLAPGATPLTVLHVSDIHLTPTQRDRIAWVRDLATLEPDLVVDTGDNLGHVDAVPPLLEALTPLLALPGAFVFGSNDYYAPKPLNPFQYFGGPSRVRHDRVELPHGRLRAALSEAGWVDLTNTRGRVHAGGRDISLVGTDDAHLNRDVMPRPEADHAELHVGVTHAPYTRVLDDLRTDGCDLILAGHTHGGQVCVPGYGALVTNCDLDTGRVKGLSGWPGARPDEPGSESTWLHVSAGLGHSPYAPVRFACRPEATLLTLVPRA
ncbi:metallophosphoesterase [Demequina capsici]|uniref:Metallophosphoesterase n=1 Tax=Demequina capsici TaxID=3075620 RepID=A0AA96FBB0_9MICO|nr:metallophosphoesterase [Demequina sp. PMTSA13]WNM27099.1 metallophosphoesterase [Demequina sp. PMTSA13]